MGGGTDLEDPMCHEAQRGQYDDDDDDDDDDLSPYVSPSNSPQFLAK